MNIRITSRSNPKEYRKLSETMKKARTILESQMHGKFESFTGSEKNLMRYRFKTEVKPLIPFGKTETVTIEKPEDNQTVTLQSSNDD